MESEHIPAEQLVDPVICSEVAERGFLINFLQHDLDELKSCSMLLDHHNYEVLIAHTTIINAGTNRARVVNYIVKELDIMLNHALDHLKGHMVGQICHDVQVQNFRCGGEIGHPSQFRAESSVTNE